MAKGGDDGNNIEVLLIGFIVLLGVLLWAFNHYKQELLLVWQWVRIGETYAFYWMKYIIPGPWEPQFDDLLAFLKATPYTHLSGESVEAVDGHVKYYFGPVFGILIFLLGSRMANRTVDKSRRLDIESLLKDRAKVFAHLNDYTDYDPNANFLDFDRNNPNAMVHSPPLSPSEYCLLNPPLGLEKKAKTRPDFRKPIWNKRDKFDIDAARESLEAQLGDPFEGIEGLNNEYKLAFDYINQQVKMSRNEIYEKAMVIIRKITDTSSGELSYVERLIYEHLTSSTKKGKKKTKSKGKKVPFNYKMDKKSIVSIYDRQKKEADLAKLFIMLKSEAIMARHAYNSTGLVALMREATSRNNFSLNTIRNELKRQNRSLYFALNCVGRNGSFIESIGINTHYMFEVDTEQPSMQPQVDLAIVGIQEELNLLEEE